MAVVVDFAVELELEDDGEGVGVGTEPLSGSVESWSPKSPAALAARAQDRYSSL